MKIKVINNEFSICKVSDYSLVNIEANYCFIAKTDEEKSLVTTIENVPKNTIQRDDGWKAFRIEGILDFSLIGVVSKISTFLAENEIGIFVISSFNTDYILTKINDFDKAIKVLEKNGYQIN